MKKRHLFLLTIIIILIVCIIAGLAFVFFFTDLFKSNKTLFSKYISQNQEIMEFLNDKDIKAYSEKQKNTPYSIEGSIKTNVTFPDSSQAQLATALQNCNITFSGKVDRPNNYSNETIKANYSDTQSMEFNLIQNNDVYAVKINDVINKYIGIKNDNLKEFARKMQLSDEFVNTIPDKIELDQLDKYSRIGSDEDRKTLKEKYTKIILDNLTNDMFSKEKNSESVVYSLSLTKSQIKNIYIKILESLKEDELVIKLIKENLINNYNFTEENAESYITEYKKYIQRLVEPNNTIFDIRDNINNSLLSQANDTASEVESESKVDEKPLLTINVYCKNNKLNKTEFITRDLGTFTLSNSNNMIKLDSSINSASAYVQKIKSSNETKLELVYSLNNTQVFDLTVSFAGLDTNSVNEMSELTFDIDLDNSVITNSKTKFVTSYKNTKTFETIQKEDVPNSEILLLNTAPSSENIKNLFEQVSNKVVEQNNLKLKAIGLTEEQNPFLYYVPSIANVASVYLIQNPDNSSVMTIPAVLTGISVSMLSGQNSILSRANSSRNQTDLATIKEIIMLDINQEFTNYYATTYSQNTTSQSNPGTLFDTLDKFLKNYQLDNDKFEYSYSNNKVVIQSKEDPTLSATGILSSDGSFKWDTKTAISLSKAEIETFNSTFEGFSGSNKTASEIRLLYSTVIANNAEEKNIGANRLIKINNSLPNSTPSNIVNTKNYTVRLEYDKETGCVNNIIYEQNN